MKQRVSLFLIGLIPLFLVSCSNGDDAVPASTQDKPTLELEENMIKELEFKTKQEDRQEKEMENDKGKKDEEELRLEDFPSEKIEYARVWSQLASNQEIDELHVQMIEAGSPLNANVESAASYPEDVIQLTGTRLIDGSITYSRNEDGTINVYHVPLRWEATTPKDFDEEAMQLFTKSIVENTELVSIDEGDEKEIIALIEKMKD